MPQKPDLHLPTDVFFKQLLSVHDRFSVISNRRDIGAVKNSFGLYGLHYAFIRHPLYNGLLGIVTYVAAESPAYRVGLRRGTCFASVNGHAVSNDNTGTIQQLLQSGEPLSIDTLAFTGDRFTITGTVACRSAYIAENPVVVSKYFQGNGIKTAYLLYNAFDETYDASLLDVFQKMKQAAVTECMLDLRYNPGGSVAGCAKMAAMLANVNAQSTFAVFQGNNFGGKRIYSIEKMLQLAQYRAGTAIAELSARRIPLKRVFVLTTRATASAAELLIHCLKPYLDVVQVGDTTTGKDEAGFQIEDQRVPRRVEWVIQPTVYKLFNSRNEGNYDKGLPPAYLADELAFFPLPPVASPADVLVAKALSLIYGSTGVEEMSLRTQRPQIAVQPVFRSATGAGRQAPPVLLPRRQ